MLGRPRNVAYRLRQLGYEVERGKNGAPEIKGYSKEYMEAKSPRSRQITNAVTGGSGHSDLPQTWTKFPF